MVEEVAAALPAGVEAGAGTADFPVVEVIAAAAGRAVVGDWHGDPA